MKQNLRSAFIGIDCEQIIRPFVNQHKVFYHPQPLHITVLHLGKQSNLTEIITIIEKIKFPGTKIKTTTLGTFNDPKEAKLIYLKLEKNKVLEQLHHTINNKLPGYKTFQVFTPHITIGRFKSPVDISALPQSPNYEIIAKKFYLYQKDEQGMFKIIKGF